MPFHHTALVVAPPGALLRTIMTRTQPFRATILILFCGMLSVPVMRAQVTTDWIQLASTQTKTGIALAVNGQDEAYVAGQYQGEIMLRKYDALGGQLWEVSSPVTVPLELEAPAQVFVDPQGDVVVVGFRYVLWNSWGRQLNTLLVLKYAPDGSLVYKHQFPGDYSSFDNQRYRSGVFSRMDAGGYVYIGTGGQVNGYPDTGFNAIKVSPAGSIVRVSTRLFPDNFFQLYSLRLLGDKLALAGATSYWDANASCWVLDTAGTTVWSNINTGEGARDIVPMADGSAFVLTWRDPGFIGDVVVYKVNADGTIGWDNTYDQGRHESALAMEPTPDGNMVVMAHGNTPGNVYSDWLTIKIQTDGTQLWAQRYNEHANNYEEPYAIRVDGTGNVYVTGDGGPWPGGFVLSKTQLVTAKYDPYGNLLWTAAVDTATDTNNGVALAMDHTGGVYMLGEEYAILIHYSDGGATTIAAPTAEGSVSTHPNPAREGFHIAMRVADEPLEFYLYDAHGKTVSSTPLAHGDRWIDRNGLPAGIYCGEVRTASGTMRTRIVLE